MLRTPLTLDAASLNASIGHLGSAQTLLRRLAAGRAVSIGVLGASVAQNGGCTSQPFRRCMSYNGQPPRYLKGFAVQLLESLNTSWPHRGHSLVNGALDATPPELLLPCLFTHLPVRLHLVILEFGSMAANTRPAGVEAVVRRLLELKPPPTLVFLTVRRFCPERSATHELFAPAKSTVWSRAEAVFTRVCVHYNVSCLSLHAATGHHLHKGTPGLTRADVAKDCLHPSTGRRGTALLVELLVNWMRRSLAAHGGLADVGQEGTSPLSGLSTASAPAPLTPRARLFNATSCNRKGVCREVASPTNARCYILARQGKAPPSWSKRATPWTTAACGGAGAGAGRNALAAAGPHGRRSGSLLRTAAHCTTQAPSPACPSLRNASEARGAWMYCYRSLPLTADGRIRDGVKRKISPGLVALQPGALLTVTADTRVVGNGRADARARVQISFDYLTSYEGFGMARVGCAGGCRCAERTVDAHTPTQNATTFQSHEIDAVGAVPDCELRFRVLDETSSGAHKFKVRYVTVFAEPPADAARRAGPG